MRRPPIRPVVWQPPRATPRAKARTGPVPLPPIRLIDVGGTGPEDVLVEQDGQVVTGVADGRLLRVHPETGLVENVAETGGRPLGIELLPDGRLLVCDAVRGLLAVDPASGSVTTLVDRVAGGRAGPDGGLLDNLPGIPDNISSGAGGLIWVALPSPRDPRLDLLHPRHPALRRLAWALPQRLLPEQRTVWTIAVDGTGTVVHDLQDQVPGYHMVTGVREHAGRLYLGSLAERAIAVMDLRV